jgi:hypothetical protein
VNNHRASEFPCRVKGLVTVATLLQGYVQATKIRRTIDTVRQLADSEVWSTPTGTQSENTGAKHDSNGVYRRLTDCTSLTFRGELCRAD